MSIRYTRGSRQRLVVEFFSMKTTPQGGIAGWFGWLRRQTACAAFVVQLRLLFRLVLMVFQPHRDENLHLCKALRAVRWADETLKTLQHVESLVKSKKAGMLRMLAHCKGLAYIVLRAMQAVMR